MRKKLSRAGGLLAVCVLAFSLVLAGCGPKKEKAEVTVTLNVTEATVLVGEQLDLTATPSDSTAELTWESASPGIAKVEANGASAKVTGVSVGSTEVRVSVGGIVKAKCVVTVEAKPEKVSINLPAKRLVLSQTGEGATLRAIVKDPSVDENSLSWSSDKPAVATVKAQGALAYVTAVAKGSCKVTVTAQAGEEQVSSTCTVTVLETVEIVDTTTKSFYAYTPDDVRSTEQFVGLANALNELVNNPDYGVGSYLTTVDDTATKVYTFNDKAYSFFTRNGVYHGFDSNSNVTDGQADFWDGFYLRDQLNLFMNESVNMLQTKGSLKNSWYYRRSKVITAAGGVDVGAGRMGYRDSLYTASGASLNFATWADDKAYNLDGFEMNYDLSGSTMSPSKSDQSVYAEIYLRTIVTGATDLTKYYGVYFDAGTEASTADLEDGAKGYWYAYEGSMCYDSSEDQNVTWPCQSVITLNTEKPIGFATWDKTNGRWVVEDLKLKLEQTYHFSDETAGKPNCTIDFKLTGVQGGKTNSVSYVFDSEKTINRSNNGVRFTYGISFTPKAPLESEKNIYGFYNNAAVPDIFNGASWKGVVQGTCIGLADGKNAGDVSFIGTGTRQYVGIWGTDALTYKKGAGITTFNFQF